MGTIIYMVRCGSRTVVSDTRGTSMVETGRRPCSQRSSTIKRMISLLTLGSAAVAVVRLGCRMIDALCAFTVDLPVLQQCCSLSSISCDCLQWYSHTIHLSLVRNAFHIHQTVTLSIGFCELNECSVHCVLLLLSPRSGLYFNLAIWLLWKSYSEYNKNRKLAVMQTENAKKRCKLQAIKCGSLPYAVLDSSAFGQ